MDDTKKTIVDAAIKGERERGSGGAVFVDASQTVIYRLLEEFPDETFRERLADMITEEGRGFV